jgi:hypothetical protein
MNKSKRKSLTLGKQTIKALTTVELRLAGGAPFTVPMTLPFTFCGPICNR